MEPLGGTSEGGVGRYVHPDVRLRQTVSNYSKKSTPSVTSTSTLSTMMDGLLFVGSDGGVDGGYFLD